MVALLCQVLIKQNCKYCLPNKNSLVGLCTINTDLVAEKMLCLRNFSQILILVLKLSKRISPAIFSLSFYSPWTPGQIATKLGTKYVMYQQLANFVLKKDIYVNRLESVNFGIQMCILQIRM